MEMTPQMAADELVRRKMLPAEWKWVLVRGKDAFGSGGTSANPLSTPVTLSKWRSIRDKSGIGVVTGDASGGLVAVDIDGPHAEQEFKAVLGGEWPDADNPETMSWRGRPGRRQLLYRIPDGIRPLLTGYTKQQFIPELKGTDEEVCVRYNGCYSVIPGSVHPDTQKPYTWISYNEGVVAPAPGWLIDFMMAEAKAKEVHSFLPQSYLEHTDASTEYSYRQMRRHFFMEGGLLEKLLAASDGAFDRIYYSEVWEADNQPLQPEHGGEVLVGGCPFHDSNSGKSFALWPNLNWYCHKEEVGGDALKLLHALRERDIEAGDPSPSQLQSYLTEIADAVGVRYPEDFREVQRVHEVKKYDPLAGRSFLQVVAEIMDLFPNPAEQDLELSQAANDFGVRKNADEIRLLLQADHDYKTAGVPLEVSERRALIKGSNYLIPDLLKSPNTVLFHGDGGCGKSLACQVIAKHIGKGIPFKIRGQEVPVSAGPVLWCNADQSPEILEEQFEDQGINHEPWLKTWHGFRLNFQKRIVDELNRLKPSLVVIDSLTASQPTIDGNKQAASANLYWLENNNGLLWPATCFLIIHHNNRAGQFRGHSSIRDAVSETWAIRKPTDAELQADGEQPAGNDGFVLELGAEAFRKRIITIGKSRNGREGDNLITTLAEDFTMSLEDYTPVQRIRRGGSVAVIDKVLSALRDATDEGRFLTRIEVEAMVFRQPGCSAVRKALQRLEKRGLIFNKEAEHQHRKQGKREVVYAAVTVQNAPSRGDIQNLLSHLTDPSPSQDFSNGTASSCPICEDDSNTLNHPQPNKDEQVHLPQMGQPTPVPFEEPSDTKASAKWDNSGPRVGSHEPSGEPIGDDLNLPEMEEMLKQSIQPVDWSDLL